MASKAGPPARFTEMMKRAKRDKDASRTAVSILKADSRVAQVLERALRRAGLSLPQFNVLMELAASPDGALPLYEINARLISTPPNTSWISTRMLESGLVTKHRAEHDSRVVIVTITQSGWAKLDEATPLVFEAEKTLFDGYARDDLRALASLLDRLLA